MTRNRERSAPGAHFRRKSPVVGDQWRPAFPYRRQLANDPHAMLIGAISFSHAPIGEVVGEFTGQPVYLRSLRIGVGHRRFGSSGTGVSAGRERGEVTAFIFPTLHGGSPVSLW